MGKLTLPRRVSVLGSTGSVGVSTLDLLDKAGAEVEVSALTAGKNVERLVEQALRWRPKLAVIEDETKYDELRARLAGSGVEAAAGSGAVADAAAGDAQWVMSAIVGFAGLAPTMSAAKAGAVIGLANKESLVCAGPSLLRTAKFAGGAVIPVDSEHSAIFQVLDPMNAQHVSRLILTASGGPFRGWTMEQMAHATPEQAVAHPKWDMGVKISIDSATMMNKGLEFIEAYHLFPVGVERLRIIVHPQSVVHSMVEYRDGSTLAQLGPSDMRVPIASALAWPARMDTPCTPLDLAAIGQLTFRAPDEQRFPATRVAREAVIAGGAAPATMNAANEIAVAAFLDGQIAFTHIVQSVEDVLSRAMLAAPACLDDVITIDAEARVRARELMERVN
ncbi:MAG: 1-deoxy-D-xylulose-5-phosphate reductoisomerase [Novosphingobium sp.]|uniref:1-deoxy-D-xylulose-5-phosphate reductoisomerase n=1 Tax=Novosphingobium sp. TaxID=1874826 RepID=UPI0027340BBB|nr:1-deoxy-D-xylulose-5-phosphate reductoisomerase [Novosphingobium sp.]MDP3551078.1 1-deoxy-D-xylulose-5-phosphate reductoisomerase [Novosphingobium sp.]